MEEDCGTDPHPINQNPVFKAGRSSIELLNLPYGGSTQNRTEISAVQVQRTDPLYYQPMVWHSRFELELFPSQGNVQNLYTNITTNCIVSRVCTYITRIYNSERPRLIGRSQYMAPRVGFEPTATKLTAWRPCQWDLLGIWRPIPELNRSDLMDNQTCYRNIYRPWSGMSVLPRRVQFGKLAYYYCINPTYLVVLWIWTIYDLSCRIIKGLHFGPPSRSCTSIDSVSESHSNYWNNEGYWYPH